MSNIVSYMTGDLLNNRYTNPNDWRNPGPVIFTWRSKEFKTPCILIFGPQQQRWLDFVKENLPKGKKIIFEGRRATNSREGHESPRLRNTIVVIDKVEDEALSEMP